MPFTCKAQDVGAKKPEGGGLMYPLCKKTGDKRELYEGPKTEWYEDPSLWGNMVTTRINRRAVKRAQFLVPPPKERPNSEPSGVADSQGGISLGRGRALPLKLGRTMRKWASEMFVRPCMQGAYTAW